MNEFNDDDYFEDKNRSLKSYLIEEYELRLKNAIDKEEYEEAAKFKKILTKLKDE